MKQKYILVVDSLPPSILQSMVKIRALPGFADCGLYVLTRQPQRYERLVAASSVPVELARCSFEDPETLRTLLKPYLEKLVGVVCRGDKRIQYLRKVVPLLPAHVRVASVEALTKATNKLLMREAFQKAYPEITPKFVRVGSSAEAAIREVEQAMTYPVIVKPANLASSLLIHECSTKAELVDALQTVFTEIQRVYEQEHRIDEPQVIVEEYLEGDFYSVDAYVMHSDAVYYTPPVAYIPAKQLGVDDFFLYKRFMPTELPSEEITAANETVRKALSAIALTYSSAHVELVRTRAGWKIIELGPRLGRFRNTMYRQAYDIDHSLNDILIHLGREPRIPTAAVRQCATYSIYPHSEGKLREIHGLEIVTSSPLLVWSSIVAQHGDVCRFAKHGGHALAEFAIASEDVAAYMAAVKEIESNVYAIVD